MQVMVIIMNIQTLTFIPWFTAAFNNGLIAWRSFNLFDFPIKMYKNCFCVCILPSLVS